MARFVTLLLAIALLMAGAPACFADAPETPADCCGPGCPGSAMPSHHTAPVHQPAHQMDCCKVAPQRTEAPATLANANPGQEMRLAAFSSAAQPIIQRAQAAPVVRAAALSPPAATLRLLCSLQI